MTETLAGMPPSRSLKSRPGLEAALAAASPTVPAGSPEPGVDLAVAGLLADASAGPGDGPLPDDGLELAGGAGTPGPGCRGGPDGTGRAVEVADEAGERGLRSRRRRAAHRGVDENAVQGRNRGNSRNGKRVRDGAH